LLYDVMLSFCGDYFEPTSRPAPASKTLSPEGLQAISVGLQWRRS